MTGANLREADLSGANMSVADLTGADLTGANFMDVDLSDANLTGAEGLGTTMTPPGGPNWPTTDAVPPAVKRFAGSLSSWRWWPKASLPPSSASSLTRGPDQNGLAPEATTSKQRGSENTHRTHWSLQFFSLALYEAGPNAAPQLVRLISAELPPLPSLEVQRRPTGGI